MVTILFALVVILPTPQPVTDLQQWNFDVAQSGALTPQLVARYKLLTWAGDGPERWRPLIERFFPDYEVDKAMRVMRCESGGNPNAKNRTSTAAGLFQFLESTWNRVSRYTHSPTYRQAGPYDPVWATFNAAWLWRHGGWGQWSCG